MAAEYFTERREVGVINIGNEGTIGIDGKVHTMAHKDALYIGRGVKTIEFKSISAEKPAKFYFVSYPLTRSTRRPVPRSPTPTGPRWQSARRESANHPPADPRERDPELSAGDGLTELDEGSVWNTMPPHTHQRRSEVYMYYNVSPDAMVIHLMGQMGETRHLIMQNEQAVLNPSWSIHAGVGTRHYSFIWAMGGENQCSTTWTVSQ